MTAPRLIAASILALAFLLPVSASAESVTFELQPRDTRVAFTLGATLHTVHGTLRARRGSVRFDPATGAAAGEIVLDAASAETGNASRDRDMHAKILESARYPEIVWRIDRVSGFPRGEARSARVTLEGSLAIHGASHPLSTTAEVAVGAGRQVQATAALEIPYVAWGMPDPSTFVLRVDKKVAVEIRAAGRLTP